MINDVDREYLEAFGRNLKKLRLEKNLSQEALCLEAELGKNQIGLIELGRLNPTLSTIKKIAQALEIEPKKMLDF